MKTDKCFICGSLCEIIENYDNTSVFKPMETAEVEELKEKLKEAEWQIKQLLGLLGRSCIEPTERESNR